MSLDNESRRAMIAYRQEKVDSVFRNGVTQKYTPPSEIVSCKVESTRSN